MGMDCEYELYQLDGRVASYALILSVDIKDSRTRLEV